MRVRPELSAQATFALPFWPGRPAGWQCGGMGEHELEDGVVRLREWAYDDAAWYAQSVRDPLIQRFTIESPALDAGQVLAAIARLRASESDVGFVICDAITGARLGNIALSHDGRSGEVFYWVAAEGRGRGVATRALVLFGAWSFGAAGLDELWLRVHRDNIASQQVAARAGYRRDPGRDESPKVKGAIWPMIGFTLPRPSPDRPATGRLPGDPARRRRRRDELDYAHPDRPAQPFETQLILCAIAGPGRAAAVASGFSALQTASRREATGTPAVVTVRSNRAVATADAFSFASAQIRQLAASAICRQP